MNAYDVVIDPTVISNCLACNFITPSRKQLLVAKATTLEIYEILKLKKASSKQVFDYKLKLVNTFKLQGLITGLKAIRTIENRVLDYVLVLTKSAKVSCIKWDSSKHAITTVSLHYYEHIFQSASYDKLMEAELLVDYSRQPLLCLRRGNLLIFLPFVSVDDDEEEDNRYEDGENVEEMIGTITPETFGYLNSTSSNLKPTNDSIIDETSKIDIDNRIGNSDRLHKQPFDVPGSQVFEASTVIDAASLDTEIGDIIDFQFLYNYREHTVAIISLVKKTWAGFLPQEKDNVVYTVWSLDLSLQAATTVLKIKGLPFDIHRIIPLMSPLNGSLLVGTNTLIHVDSGGITRRVSLNSFVYDTTSLYKDFLDLSHNELMLEDCSISLIPNDNKALLVLRTGQMYMLVFDIEGKTIKGLTVETIESSLYDNLRTEHPGSIIAIEENLLFLSGKSSESTLVEVSYSPPDETRPNLSESKIGEKSSLDLDEDEDDLYDEDESSGSKMINCGRINFVIHDTIEGTGPLTSFTLGKYSGEKFVANLPNPSYNEVSIVAAGGAGKSSCLNIMTPTVQPIIRSSLRFSQINKLWIVCNRFLITSDDHNSKSEIFDINKSYARIPSEHFINTAMTIAMHELGDGSFILQVTPKHVVLLNADLKSVATLEKELKEFGDAYITNSVFNEDFLMMFFSTGEVVIYNINTYNKSFTKVDLPSLLSDTIITTGYITNSRVLNIVLKDITVLTKKCHKRKRDLLTEEPAQTRPSMSKAKTFVLVTGDNRIVMFSRFHKEKCFQLNSVSKFTNRLSLGFFDINGTDPDPFIKQVILSDLGDEFVRDEYLTILTVGGEIVSYKMYFDGENYSFVKEVHVPITGAPENAFPYGTSLERRMIYFADVSGMTCLMVTGVVPYLITRSRHSLVKIHKFSKVPIISFVPYSDKRIKNGLIYLDTKKNARIVELPKDFNYDNNWPVRKISIGATIKDVTYHESSHTYIVSTFEEIPYKCLDEDGTPVVGTNSEKPPALSYKGCIHLISPLSWTSIDSIILDDNEVGLQMKSMALDIGSETKRFKRRKEFVLVGSGKYRMEDLACNGSYRLLEIIDIIPEPGRPETNHKFKEYSQEDTRGAVTALCDVSGRFLVAQGQKVFIRDIRDSTAVPVAFMDLSVYVSEAKSFGNLLLFGDTLKSVSLAGFDAEPFRMISLGKDTSGIDVNCADFIYKDENIYIVVADNDKNIHILQYNPEDPASSNGQRLLHRSSFNSNFNTTCMRSIPRNEETSNLGEPTKATFQIIASTSEGAIYTVFPTEESSFRRMFVLQQQLIDKEYHHCGLNPRLNRLVHQNKDQDHRLRPILDNEILKRFSKLNRDRMRLFAQKVSTKNSAVDLWRDLISFQNGLNSL